MVFIIPVLFIVLSPQAIASSYPVIFFSINANMISYIILIDKEVFCVNTLLVSYS